MVTSPRMHLASYNEPFILHTPSLAS